MKLFSNMSVKNNTLHINGNSIVDLAKKYETPLFVLDGDYVKQQIKVIKDKFKHIHLDTEILYASKAFSSKGFYRLIAHEGLSLDVVSGGELYTAKASDFPMNRVYFHGNNKSAEELQMALEYGVHRIVVDNLMELQYLASLNRPASIMLRVNPGIEAHTHEYIQTAKDDSKFGIPFGSYDLSAAMALITENNHITLTGFHCHIGSQIHEASSFLKTAEVMLDQIKLLEYKYQLKVTELNLGGGFGVYYKNDQNIEDFSFLNLLLDECYHFIVKNELSIKKIMIEPGRLLVANAGSTIYKVGYSKETLSGKQFVFVDGGMTDNIRPALYQAEYEACIGNKVLADESVYTVAGKCCESGDVIIKEIMLPKAIPGDYLVVSSTGAYGYSMASQYNRIPRPAVIMINEGIPEIIIRRETYDDLIRLDQ